MANSPEKPNADEAPAAPVTPAIPAAPVAPVAPEVGEAPAVHAGGQGAEVAAPAAPAAAPDGDPRPAHETPWESQEPQDVREEYAPSPGESRPGEDAASASPEEPPARPRKAKRSRHTGYQRESPAHRRRNVLIAVALAVTVLVALALVFCWNRWWRFDDAADFQGEWRVSGSSQTIVIDGSQMKIADDVAYNYTLDTQNKQVSLSFAGLTGGGWYRFSTDRNTLAITDGAEVDLLMALGLAEDTALAGGEIPEGTSVLVRVSRDTTGEPRDLGDASITKPLQTESDLGDLQAESGWSTGDAHDLAISTLLGCGYVYEAEEEDDAAGEDAAGDEAAEAVVAPASSLFASRDDGAYGLVGMNFDGTPTTNSGSTGLGLIMQSSYYA